MRLLVLLAILFLGIAGCKSQSNKYDRWGKEAREHYTRDSIDGVRWEDSIKKIGYRRWCVSDFGIHASDGIPDGKAIQYLIDSALLFPGLTDIAFDEAGNYCTGDVKTIYWNMRLKKDIGFVRMYICPETIFGSILVCDTLIHSVNPILIDKKNNR